MGVWDPETLVAERALAGIWGIEIETLMEGVRLGLGGWVWVVGVLEMGTLEREPDVPESVFGN